MRILNCIKPAMPAFLTSVALIGAAAWTSLLAPTMSFAADSQPIVNEQFADLDPAIKMMRDEAGKDRREIVKSAMLLTESEAAVFWPLYDKYRGEQHKLGDRRVRLISDFAANQSSMSEDQAAELTKESLAIDKEKTSIKTEYVAKMSKVLSARTVARFFQIDHKLDTIVDSALAARIPLIH